MARLLVLVGTRKGLFILSSDPARRDVVYQQNHSGIYRLDRAARDAHRRQHAEGHRRHRSTPTSGSS